MKPTEPLADAVDADPRYRRFVALLLDAPTRVTATAPDEAYERHVVDALTALPELTAAPPGPLVDVGSGGGVPGVVLAIALPDRAVTLVEATGRKAAVLAGMVTELGLERVTVVNARAEDHAAKVRDAFAVATARALAPPPVAAELCLPYVRPGGIAVLYAGAVDRDALEHAAAAVGGALESVRAVAGSDRRTIVVIRKIAPTPPGFPRRVGLAAKRPLTRFT